VFSQSLLQVAEIWTPDPSGHSLTLQSGCYGESQDFRSVSAGMEFRKGVGLPGRVWESEQPIVLNHFRGGSGFMRSEAAARAGLVAGLGFPVFRGEKCAAVCLLLFGGPQPQAGVLEVWAPEVSGALALVSGYHGQLDTFRRVSALMKIPSGIGLPGRVLEARAPMLLESLSDSTAFIRAAAAETYGLHSGLGLPIFSDGVLTSIVVMLAGRSSPLARSVEVWVPNSNADELVLAASAYETQALEAAAKAGPASFRKGQGLPGALWESGMPVVVDSRAEGADQLSATLATGDLEMGIGIPIFDGEMFRGAVLLLN